ncbi:MAG: hypothetical protein LBF08_00175 [Dysgonamonadaceae bacterium]|jgi:hypothetical protein|nr:hypothetical protein [Dysgonamonadaceae bacterium]
MEHTILLRNFKIEKRNGKYLYSVQIFEQGIYSFLSDGKMNEKIEKAKAADDEERYWESIEIACKKILTHNNFFFDEIEII